MNNEKPKDRNGYIEWLKKEHKIEISAQTKTYYDTVTNRIKTDFEESNCWVALIDNLTEFDSQYYSQKEYHLLLTEAKPELYIKPFESFLGKTLRKNVLQNQNWPGKPDDGWIFPTDWYSRIDDIIRTLIVVKYLDGVEFMVEKIHSLYEQHGLPCIFSYEAKEEGYYAAHLYAKREFEIPRPRWDTEKIIVSIEIQITTQIQEAIRKLLHKYYEERRQGIVEEDTKWQWNYKSDEFDANYLGHILHYVEGKIMGIRERQKEEIT